MDSYVPIYESLPFPSLLLEPEEEGFVVVDANARICELLAKSKEELLGKSYPNILEKGEKCKEIRHKRLFSLRTVLRTGKPHKLKFLKTNLTSSQKGENEMGFWCVENIPIKDKSGKVVRVLNVATDQTSNILKTQEIEEDQALQIEKQQHFIDKNRDGLYSLDREGNFTSLNEGLARLAELPQEELINTSFLPFCAPQDREVILHHFSLALNGGKQVFEADFISFKGTQLVLEISLVPIVIDGEITGVYGIAKDFTQLREKEKELFRSQKRFKALVHEGSDLLGILEPDGTYKFVSDTVEKVLGTDAGFYIGKNAFDFIHPDDKEKVMADFSLLGNKKQIKVGLFRFQDAQGNWRWMETVVTNLLDDPYVEGIVTNSREVTELVEKTKKISQLYERYTLAAEATEDVIYDWDLVTNEVVRFHKSSEKLFGYSPKEIDDPNFWKSNIHPEDLPHVMENLNQHLEDPKQQQIKSQYRFRQANGAYAQIIDRSSIVRNEEGEAVRLIGATIDISEIVSNKEALKMANKRFSYAMKATKEMIWDWDIIHGRIKRSDSFKKIFGYSTSRIPSVEKFWFDKIVEKDREKIRQSLQKALDDPNTKKWREEYCFLKKDQEEAHVIDRGYILRDRQGKALRMVGAVLDVTESRKMIKEIQKQNEVLKEVAWEQAHVVRAPLARLKGLLDLLEEESYEEWSREELVGLIRSSAEEVDEIIEKIVRKTEKIEI